MTFLSQMSNNADKSFEKGGVFLQLILERLEKAGVQYCIARNYEKYPHVITGDVDIVLPEHSLHDAVRETQLAAKHLNWSPFITYIGSRAAHIGFYAKMYPARFVLTIEFFVGGTWRGLQFLCGDRAIHMRQRHGDFWKPNPAHEAIITLVHHLLYNHRVFDKYRSVIRTLANKSPAIFERELSYSLGKQTARLFTELVLAEDWNGLEEQGGSLRRKFIFRSLFLHPWSFATGVYKVILDIGRKPEGVVISIENLSVNSAEAIADEIIQLAVRWHIFLPPNRKKILFSNGDTVKLIKSTVASGGVTVVLNNLGESLGVSLSFPIIHVEEEGGHLMLRIGSELGRPINRETASMEIWNTVLQHRSNAIKSTT